MSTLDAVVAENELIATALADPKKFYPAIRGEISIVHLSDANNGVIWDVLETLHKEGRLDEGINAVKTLARQRLPEVAGVIIDRFMSVPLSGDWRAQAHRIKEAFEERRFRRQIQEANVDLDRGQDAETVLNRLREQLTTGTSNKEHKVLAELWRPVGESLKANLDESLSNQPKARDWLLTDENGEGVFPAGKCGILTAGGGTGKTAALCQLAVSVVLGVDWLGFKVPKQGKVILALGEEDLSEVWRRLHTISSNLHLFRKQTGNDAAKRSQLENDVARLEKDVIALPLAGIPVSFVEKRKDNIDESQFLEQFRSLLSTAEGVRLVILDPLARFAGLETEKDNAAATRFVQAVESLATQSGASVMVASHASQQSQQAGQPNVRGVTAIVDGFRWVASLTKTKANYIKLEQLKTNYSAWFEAQYLQMPKTDKGKVIPVLVKADTQKAIDAIEAAEAASKKRKRNEAPADQTSNREYVKAEDQQEC